MIKAFILGLLIALVTADAPIQHLNILNDLFSGTFFGKKSVFGNQDDSEIDYGMVNQNDK
jgi:hypothetical protein